MINKGRITLIQDNILQGLIITTQHNYGPHYKYVASDHALYKKRSQKAEVGSQKIHKFI
jgi:hypothetical protein